MKIALYGATGMVGQRILHEALERGHTVTAIVRDPAKLTETNTNLRVVQGNINDPQSIQESAAGQDAVVVSVSGRSDGKQNIFVDAANHLLEILPQIGVKRLLFVGGAGSLEAAPGLLVIDTPGFPDFIKPEAQAAADALAVFRNTPTELDWTYFSPPGLIEPGERTGKFRLGGDQLLTDADGNSRISAEDYAVALIDELENPQHRKQRFTAAY